MLSIIIDFNPLRPRGRRPVWHPHIPNQVYFNPLRPRGRRPTLGRRYYRLVRFQPTPPARTETRSLDSLYAIHQFQPTPPARTETHSIFFPSSGSPDFNPLRPRGRRHFSSQNRLTIMQISTHSAREDGDSSRPRPGSNSSNFNPLRPRGRRHPVGVDDVVNPLFQPTPPARTETMSRCPLPREIGISTHSAREDGDKTNCRLLSKKV